jgi:hypothetical protein
LELDLFEVVLKGEEVAEKLFLLGMQLATVTQLMVHCYHLLDRSLDGNHLIWFEVDAAFLFSHSLHQ